jgi:hypothetical protein
VNFDSAIWHDSNHFGVIALRLSTACTAQLLVNALTGNVGNGTVLVAVAKRLRDDLELILIHHVADPVRVQHLHGDAVILKNSD